MQALRRADFQLASFGVCQLKLIYAYYSLRHSAIAANITEVRGQSGEETIKEGQLLKPEFLLSLKNRLEQVFDKWQKGNSCCMLYAGLWKYHDQRPTFPISLRTISSFNLLVLAKKSIQIIKYIFYLFLLKKTYIVAIH